MGSPLRTTVTHRLSLKCSPFVRSDHQAKGRIDLAISHVLAPRCMKRRATAEPASAPAIASTTSVQSCQSKPELLAGFPMITSVIRRPTRKPTIAPTMPPSTTIDRDGTPMNTRRQACDTLGGVSATGSQDDPTHPQGPGTRGGLSARRRDVRPRAGLEVDGPCALGTYSRRARRVRPDR
jgi:hypothetical protein